MKNLSFLALLCLIISISSCTTDPAELIQGTWELADMDYSGETVTSSTFTEDIITPFVGVAKEIDYKMTFNDDEVFSEGGYTVELTSTTNGVPNTQDVELEADFDGTYVLLDDIITITTVDGTFDYTILESTASKLVLNNISKNVSSIGGVTNTSSIDLTLMFTK